MNKKIIFLFFVISIVQISYGQHYFVISSDSTTSSTVPSASSSVALYVGLSFPVGKFASTNTDDSEAGFAKIGPTFGLGVYFNITHSIAYALGINVAFNGLNLDPVFNGTGIAAESGYYTNIWVLNGFKYSKPINESINFNILGQVGILWGYIPEVALTKGNMRGKIKSSVSNSFGFGLGLGVGIDIGHFMFSLRYYSGTSEYEDQNVKKFNQPAWCIVPCVGIVF